MLAETEIARSSPLPLEASWAVVSTSWDPADASKYYRARYYDPKIGRFISEDPIGFAGGINFFAYVHGRPTLLIDPLGLADLNYFHSDTSPVAISRGAYTTTRPGLASTCSKWQTLSCDSTSGSAEL